MKKLFFVLSVFLFFKINILQSQTSPNYIEVIGYAETDIVPNEIYYKVELGDKRLGKDFYKLEDIDKIFWSVIEKHNIDKSKVKVFDTNSRNIQYRRKKDEVLKTKTYEILFEEINLLDQFSGDLSKVEIINSHISRLHHSQVMQIEEDLKISAIKNAKDKALKLLNAVNEEIGILLEVTELEQNSFKAFMERQYYTLSRYQNAYANASARFHDLSTGSALDFREVKMTTTIKVKYEIKNEK